MYFIAAVTVLLFILNITATVILSRSIAANKEQKMIQSFIVWLVPLSSVIIIFIHKEKSLQYNKNFQNSESRLEGVNTDASPLDGGNSSGHHH